MSEFLKCDAVGCTHVETVGEITETMIGMPCPVCGASLLTAEDFAFYDKMVRPSVKAMETAGLLQPAEPETPGAVRINYHDGELRVRMAAAKPTT